MNIIKVDIITSVTPSGYEVDTVEYQYLEKGSIKSKTIDMVWFYDYFSTHYTYEKLENVIKCNGKLAHHLVEEYVEWKNNCV